MLSSFLRMHVHRTRFSGAATTTATDTTTTNKISANVLFILSEVSTWIVCVRSIAIRCVASEWRRDEISVVVASAHGTWQFHSKKYTHILCECVYHIYTYLPLSIYVDIYTRIKNIYRLQMWVRFHRTAFGKILNKIINNICSCSDQLLCKLTAAAPI